MKTLHFVTLAALAPIFALAEDVPDVSAVVGELEKAQTFFETLITSALPIVGGVIVVGLAVWALPRAVGWVKRAFGR